jgi:DNA (cytosine-5)-methyltransferase 1
VKPRLLDLFCGAGGAGMGYHLAGFDVVGVDIKPQPDYPFEFRQADAMTFPLQGFSAVHGSPPCQAFTAMGVMWNAKKHHDLLTPTRARFVASGLPYVIENVPGAPMSGAHVTLCGTSFGLGAGEYELRRHRHFEMNFPIMVPGCQHTKPTIGIYGDHARDRRRVSGQHHDRGRQFAAGTGVTLAREAMGMPWASWHGLSQAIPPAYTEYIGGVLMDEVWRRRNRAVAA